MGNALKDKVAIITGGGRGIGKAIAEAYAREGAQVVVTSARNKKEIDEVAARIQAFPLLSDITNKEDVDNLIHETLRRFGTIDILVNNAARGMRFVNERFMTDSRPFWEADPDMWQMVVNTNINGVFLVTRSVIPHMLKQKGGSIINISINLETMRRKGFSPYGPSKAALESMSLIWAQELEGTGINMNILLPGGATLTGMIPEIFPQEQKALLLKPEIMGPPAVYLASQEARCINGKRIIAVEWNKENGIII